MASLNTVARELVLKIVYYGPGLGGKTSSLQALHDASPLERRGKLVSLATPVDRTLYFDFLPLRLPPLRGLAVRLQLFTVPGQVYFNATRRLVLSGADGVVFVADAQRDRLDANLESLENLRENLAEHGRELASLPHAFAYNKRDLPEILSHEELEKALNAHGAPSFGTVATRGEGVQATLDEMIRMVLRAYEAQLPEPAASERAVHVDDAPPSVRVSQEMPAVQGDDPEIVTGVAVLTSEPVEEVFGSTAGNGTFLPDVANVEKEPESRGLSFAPLFAPGERALIEQIEQAIAHGDHGDAVGMCDAAISRILTNVAAIVSGESKISPADPSLPLLLGLDGRRYLAFRALARRARQIGDVGVRDALESFAFVLEARVAAGQWESVRSAVGASSQPPPSRMSTPPPSGLPPLPRGTISPPAHDS